MRIVAVWTVPLASWLFAGLAGANDSIGHLTAGGIELARSSEIEMRAEDLYISPSEIRVRYRFYNRALRDIETLVAFPMPEVPPPSDLGMVAIPHEDQENFLGFATTVEGAPKEVKVEARAVAMGLDRTDLLTGMGVPLQPHSPKAHDALQRLPREKLNELLALGLIRIEDMDSMAGAAPVFFPSWSMRATYYWTQLFPAQREIVIEHTYAPSVGASVQTLVGAPFAQGNMEEYKHRYCMDEDFLKAAAAGHQNLKDKHSLAALGEKRISYVLSTGSNWAGPIKDFKLTVDKVRPGALVSFCGEGVRKVSPTTFEMTKRDYWPSGNLEVLLLEPMR